MRKLGTSYLKRPKAIQKDIIEHHDGRRAIDHAHEAAKLLKWAYEIANNE